MVASKLVLTTLSDHFYRLVFILEPKDFVEACTCLLKDYRRFWKTMETFKRLWKDLEDFKSYICHTIPLFHFKVLEKFKAIKNQRFAAF